MWTLSGFCDEIADDLAIQCEVVTSLAMTHVEFRSAWGVNVAELDDDQLDRARDILAEAGLLVSCIGSPIGKIAVEDDFAPHLEQMHRIAQVARVLGTRYVRVFSFFIKPDDDPDRHRDEVLRRMEALAAVAEQTGVVLLHENEKAIYGDIPRRCADIVESVGSPNLRATWDPANFVQVGVRPFTEGYALLRPHLEYMQIKDATFADRQVKPAGAGDGQVLETIRALRSDGFDGYFSLEPHLAEAHELGGFSGPALFTKAHRAFTDMLRAEGIGYR
ncbi:MAG: sugar phosphate isomerase/epimerase family protein [Cellulomonadaceae bacterium]